MSRSDRKRNIRRQENTRARKREARLHARVRRNQILFRTQVEPGKVLFVLSPAWSADFKAWSNAAGAAHLRGLRPA